MSGWLWADPTKEAQRAAAREEAHARALQELRQKLSTSDEGCKAGQQLVQGERPVKKCVGLYGVLRLPVSRLKYLKCKPHGRTSSTYTCGSAARYLGCWLASRVLS
jgi:hypothetical protein